MNACNGRERKGGGMWEQESGRVKLGRVETLKLS